VTPPTVEDIDPTTARALVADGAFLLDVREDDEWTAGRAPDAVHIPMGQIVDRLDEVPSDQVVVCLCRVGGRSASVAGALAGQGYDVRNVAGGMQAWEKAGFPVVADGDTPGTVI
jgi:rhodanese-related sulfurtransferase